MEEHENGIQAAIDAGKETQSLERRAYLEGFDDVPIAIDEHGKIAVLRDVVELHDQRADRPRRRKGTATLTELESFVAHVQRNRLADSVIFAHGQRLAAVYNYNAPSAIPPAEGGPWPDAAWGDHRAIYTCPPSDEWQAWETNSGRALTQEELHKFLDAHFGELRDYPGDKRQSIPPCTTLELLALGDYLELHTTGTFKVSRRRGERKLECSSEQSAAESTKIPQRFALELPVFLGGQVFPIESRLELSIKENRPLFTFELLRAGAVKREAFAAVRAAVAEQTGLPVFAGSPETA
jgi:uncharacterized protein YfdQ (DUF2303 family)